MQEHHSPEHIEAAISTLQQILTDHYAEPEAQSVLNWSNKAEVVEKFSEPEVPHEGMGLDGTLNFFREQVLPYSVKTWHPRFFNQMFAGVSFPGIIGDMMASMMNPTLATWEMSPVATIIERNVSQWMAGMLGMKPGSSGIFLPGGSLSNLMGLITARNHRLGPDAALKGVQSLSYQPVIICSDASHYSIANAGDVLGIGKEHVIKVRTNQRQEMLIDDLKEKLAECAANNQRPFALVATMGTTVTGGFDPLKELVPICKEHNIHLHVDAAFGGGFSLSKDGRTVFEGIEHADTVIWDAHKWLHVPLTCTVLLAPDARLFKQIFSSNANYLFHPQAEEIDIADDLGQYTLLCGKRFDALRVWILFKAYGQDYFRDLAQSRVELARDFYRMLCDDPDFVPSYEPASPLQCFRYEPEQLRGIDQAYADRLHRHVREQAKQKGLAMFNITHLKGRDHFRTILINPLTTTDHLKTLLEDMRNLAEAYIATSPPPVTAAGQ